MARRRLVSPEIWAGHYSAPLDEREIARHYTLTSDDMDVVGRLSVVETFGADLAWR